MERKKIRNKKIKLLIYFRKHNNKNYSHIFKLIEKLVSKNFKVHVIGDKLNLKGIKITVIFHTPKLLDY